MDNKTAFLAGSILDTQTTIRAIDVKIGALLVGLLAPFAAFGRVWGHFMHVCQVEPIYLGIGLSVTFFLTWICSVIALVRALSAIDNPARHIVNSGKYKGSFYGGGLYVFGFLDAFLNRPMIKASTDIPTMVANAPDTKDQIIEELAFEQLKLIYIRDMKLFRLQTGINFATIWLGIGIASFLYSKLG